MASEEKYMTKQTHVVDGVAYCGTLEVALPFVGMRDATLGSCGIGPEPPGRQKTATLKYPNYPGSGMRTVDCTLWDNVFGHSNSVDPVSPWPGASGSSPAFIQFTGSGYVALEFTPTKKAQVLVNISSYNGLILDGAWSTSPGNFTDFMTRGPGETFQKLSTDPAWPGFYIPLGQKAYLNLRAHTVSTANRTLQLNLSYTLHG